MRGCVVCWLLLFVHVRIMCCLCLFCVCVVCVTVFVVVGCVCVCVLWFCFSLGDVVLLLLLCGLKVYGLCVVGWCCFVFVCL